MTDFKNKTVSELLDIVKDVTERLAVLEGNPPEVKFVIGDIVRIVSNEPMLLSSKYKVGEYCKVRRVRNFNDRIVIKHPEMSALNECYPSQLKLVWRD